MGRTDINLAGLCFSSAEWEALDAALRADLLRAVAATSEEWDQNLCDSEEWTVACAEPAPRTIRTYPRMQTKLVRFVALSAPLGV